MLPPEVKAMVDLIQASPSSPGPFGALLTLLEASSDSGVIVEALTVTSPTLAPDMETRERAAALLDKTEAFALAQKWRSSTPENVEDTSNIVSLHPGNDPRPAERIHGQVVSFDDIGGLEKVKNQVRRKIIRPFENPSLFAKYKRKAGGGVLLYGPPGCGKTMIARAVAHECKATFTEVRAADILDRWVGVAEERIAEVFERARADRPAVLFFDEIEALAQRRQFDSRQNVNTVVSTLLTEMDSFDGRNEGILFLGATNIPWSLDSAFRRPGRFDRMLFVPPPDKIAREFILKQLLMDRPVSDALNIQAIVDHTSGFSGADLSALVETAVDYAIDTSLSPDNYSLLTDEHFGDAFDEVRATTGEWLAEAKNFSAYANQSGIYDDLKEFLKRHTR